MIADLHHTEPTSKAARFVRPYRPRLLLILPSWLPSASIYIIKPLQQLERQGLAKLEYALERDLKPWQIHASDLVLFCRNSDPVYGWALEECLAKDIPTVYDLDDNFWEVPLEFNYARLHRSPERIRQLEQYLSSARVVRVYSPYLARLIQHFNRDIRVIPPSIDLRLVPPEPLPKTDPIIRITYVTGRGSADPLIDLFADDLLRILDENRGEVEMTWWGEIPPKFRHHPSCRVTDIIYDYDLFLQRLSRMQFDIGLAPLLPTSFYLSKTNTKFRDYGACRIAGIYSDVEVYNTCVEHERTGLLVSQASTEAGAGSWYQAINRLIHDETLRQGITQAAFEYVQQNYRQELMEAVWVQLIDELLSQSRSTRRPAGFPVIAQSPSAKLKIEITPPTQQPDVLHAMISLSREHGSRLQLLADLRQPLPIASACADLVVIEHALDALDQPLNPLTEIYRLCKSLAQVCLLATYNSPGIVPDSPAPADAGEQFLQGETASAGESSPFQPFGFNEFTPLALASKKPIVYRDYPLLQKWNFHPMPLAGIDLHCLRMEMFYLPQFLQLTEEQRMAKRCQQDGISDQILYHFLAIKPGQPVNAELLAELKTNFEPYQPVEAVIRRLQDANLSLKDTLEQLRFEQQSWRSELAAREQRLVALEGELKASQEQIQALNIRLQKAQEDLTAAQTQAQTLAGEAQSAHALLQAKDAELKARTAESAGLRLYLERQMALAKLAAAQLDAFRQRRIIRWVDRIVGRNSDEHLLSTAYQALRDDSLIFGFSQLPAWQRKGWRLLPSINLQSVPYLAYRLMWKRPGLSTISFAPLIDLLPSKGEFGLEVLAPDGRVLRHVRRPANEMIPGEPFEFSFDPIPETKAGLFEVRLCGRDLDVPVRAYEWRRYRFFGLIALAPRPFLGFTFHNA